MDDNKSLQDQVTEDVQSAAIAAAQQVDFLVKQISADLDKLAGQISEQRQMVKDTMQGDSRYQDISEKIKDLNKQRAAIQKELSANEGVRKAKQELQELNNQRKELQDKLSKYLEQYVTEFNTKTLEDLEGNLKEIITQYKLIRSRSVE